MGDCIKQARAFVQCCHKALDRANVDCAQDMTDVLAEIQSGAKLNHARAIYRSAQDALQSLNDKDRLPLRLHALSNVVSLYETGLTEMEDSCEEISSELEPQESADIIPVDFSETARQARAVEAMQSTLPFVDAAQKPAFDSLLASSQTSPNPENIVPEVSFDPVDLQAEPLKELIEPNISAASEPAPRESKVALESFIRDIVQNGLSVARQATLTVSLSYDMGGVTLPESKADLLKIRAETWLSYLIRHLAATTSPETLCQIDISATARTMTFRTIASPLGKTWKKTCDHPDLVSIDHDPVSNSLYLKLDYAIQKAKPAPKMPVEEGISSRLEALLDTPLADGFSPNEFRVGAIS